MINFENKNINEIDGNQKKKYGLYCRTIAGTAGYTYTLIEQANSKEELKKKQIKKDGDRIFSIEFYRKILK